MNDTSIRTELFSPLLILGMLVSSCLTPILATPLDSSETNILYVSVTAEGNNDGSSWQHAFISLQDALLTAQSAGEEQIQLWIAAGTYTPLTSSFILSDGIQLYGGFQGNENTLEDRDWQRNKVILRGSFFLNVHHILYGQNLSGHTLLDGLSITGGYAQGSGNDRHGAALYLVRTDGSLTEGPTIQNCSFYDNHAPNGDGGAVYLQNAIASFNNCTFFKNDGRGDGGAICIQGSISDVSISRSRFYQNFSQQEEGGALACFGRQVFITNSLFIANKARQGGGVYTGKNSEISMESSVCYQNELYSPTEMGSAVRIRGRGEISNSIIWENLGNSIVSDEGALDLKYSIVQGGYTGAGIIEEDPLFTLPQNHDFSLKAGSPAINAGLTSLISTQLDYAGNGRVQDQRVDIGAFEFDNTFCVESGSRLYVDKSATGTYDGSSWTDAFTSLQDALGFARQCGGITEVWIAAGTYLPTEALDRNASFHLVNGVSLYGGFSGGESSREERDPISNLSILSGDQGVAPYKSFHVVQGTNIDSTTTLSGLIIRDGSADFQGRDENVLTGTSGVGMLLTATAGSVCNPYIHECAFAFNRSTNSGLGGGLYLDRATPRIDRCAFDDNFAEFDGGGIMIEGSEPVRITNSLFRSNSCFDGGGAIAINGPDVSLENCLFLENFAEIIGGGAIYTQFGVDMQLDVVNCNFIQNRVDEGEGAALEVYGTTQIANSIFWANGDQGSPLDEPSEFKAAITGNLEELSMTYSIFQDGWPGKGNLAADPQFEVGGFQLTAGSPAINAGLNSVVKTSKDIYGETRKVGASVDIGVAEFQTLPEISVKSFFLVDANSNKRIKELVDGDLIDWRQLPGPINIEAITEGDAKSVKFELAGTSFVRRTENVIPWALFGDNKGDFSPWRPIDGKYTLTATPYDLKGAVGEAGESLTIRFEVIGRSTAINFPGDFQVQLYPNPSQGITTLSLPSDWFGETDIHMFDQTGREVFRDQLAEGVSAKRMDFHQLSAGIYLLHIQAADRQEVRKLILRK
ncbi:MAG: choice-of-anchor Q domain-containing protein [Bacteroidota bacterium]